MEMFISSVSAALSLMAMVMILVLDTFVAGASVSNCPPSYNANSTTIPEMIFYSDVLLIGRVTRRYPEDATDTQSYTAEVEVRCVYKTDDSVLVPPTLNITHAGVSAESCLEAQLTAFNYPVNAIVMAFLLRHDGQYTSSYPPLPEGYADEVTVVCEVETTYPQGVTKETSLYTCPENESESDDYEGEDNADDACLSTYVPMQPGLNYEESDNHGHDVPYREGDVQKTGLNAQGSTDDLDDDDDDNNGSASLTKSTVSLLLTLVLISLS